MESLESIVADLLPESVRIAVAPIEDVVGTLHPEERALVAKAVASRQQEFATGRWLARGLLEEFGHRGATILREDDRIPRWPTGIVGSITHSKKLCMAAVASAERFHGVGIDLEPDEAVDREIERVVCRGAEHDWVAAAGEAERGRRCRIVFSVKEAVYKAFYPRTRTFWSFQDVLVEIDLAAETYRASLPESAGIERVHGRVQRRGGWIVSGLAIETETFRRARAS